MANSIFLGLNTGQSQTITVNGIATTSTDGLVLQNATPATAGVTVQQSPRLTFSGSAWNSVGAVSETDNWIVENRPVSVAGTTSAALFFSRSIAGGAFTDQMNLTSTGTLTIAHKLTITDNVAGELTMPANGFFDWNGRAAITSPTNAVILLQNFNNTAGVGLDATVADTLTIKNFANSTRGTLDALGYKVGGAAGANFGPSAVASLTVVNGLVTAAS